LTLQDYYNLSTSSISKFFSSFGTNFSNIVAAIIALTVGLVIGAILKKVIVEISKAVSLEKSLSDWGTYQKLTKSHEALNVTEFLGELARWISIIIFLIPAVESLEISGTDVVVSQLLNYIPSVLIAAIYLLLGFVFAWFLHRLVQSVAIIVGTNPAHTIANVVYLAVVAFATISALLQLGLGFELIRWIFLALLAGLALSFGLAGKDTAGDIIKKFQEKAK